MSMAFLFGPCDCCSDSSVGGCGDGKGISVLYGEFFQKNFTSIDPEAPNVFPEWTAYPPKTTGKLEWHGNPLFDQKSISVSSNGNEVVQASVVSLVGQLSGESNVVVNLDRLSGITTNELSLVDRCFRILGESNDPTNSASIINIALELHKGATRGHPDGFPASAGYSFQFTLHNGVLTSQLPAIFEPGDFALAETNPKSASRISVSATGKVTVLEKFVALSGLNGEVYKNGDTFYGLEFPVPAGYNLVIRSASTPESTFKLSLYILK